jgi:hypothetical protein
MSESEHSEGLRKLWLSSNACKSAWFLNERVFICTIRMNLDSFKVKRCGYLKDITMMLRMAGYMAISMFSPRHN